MPTYQITFTGRLNGAIGIFHRCEEIVHADTEHQAQIKLYNKYDAVHSPLIRVIEVADPPEPNLTSDPKLSDCCTYPRYDPDYDVCSLCGENADFN